MPKAYRVGILRNVRSRCMTDSIWRSAGESANRLIIPHTYHVGVESRHDGERAEEQAGSLRIGE